MVLEKLLNLLPEEKDPLPNKISIYIGEQIRKARDEAGISQETLARKAYLRRPTLSDIENGKSQINASTLGLISYYLRKPLSYFYPPPLYEELVKKDMDELSLEMQMQFEQIYADELKRLAINVIRVFAKFDPKDLVISMAPHISARLEREKELEEARQKKINKK